MSISKAKTLKKAAKKIAKKNEKKLQSLHHKPNNQLMKKK
jgi:hypothetical protein